MRYFSQRIHRLKICSGAPSCSEACLFFSDDISAHGFNLFSMIFIMTLLGWLMRLIVRYFWHCCRLPFLESVMTKDWVHRVGHSPVCQILLQIVMRAVVTSSPLAWTSLAWMLSTPADFPFFNNCIVQDNTVVKKQQGQNKKNKRPRTWSRDVVSH